MTDRTNTKHPASPAWDEHVDETSRLISSTKVKGTKVLRPPMASNMGSGSTVRRGQDFRQGSLNAVMSFGGFLGIGERYHTRCPWGRAEIRTPAYGGLCRQHHARQARGRPEPCTG